MVIKHRYGSLDYIRERGYASYSSLKRVRDGEDNPQNVDAHYFIFGSELHSRFLENETVNTLNLDQEDMLTNMLHALNSSKMVRTLLEPSAREVKIDQVINRVPIIGYIDIINYNRWLADLKSTQHTRLDKFVDSIDFMQAALYQKATGIKSFYFIGVSKTKRPEVMIFDVNQYPDRLKKAKQELNQLLKYVAKSL